MKPFEYLRSLKSLPAFIVYTIISLYTILAGKLMELPTRMIIYAAASAVIIAAITFIPGISVKIQAYVSALTFSGYAIIYSFNSDNLRGTSGLFLVFVCLLTSYQLISANIFVAVISTLFYIYSRLFRKVAFEASFDSAADVFFQLLLLYAGIAMTVIFIYRSQSMARLSEQRAEEAAAAARAKADFLANMSHEIRTPMNSICGMVELLANTDIPPAGAEYIKTIRASSANLLSIINDVLDFSKIDAGKMEIMESSYSIEDLVYNVSSIISTRIADKNIAFVVSVDPNIPRMLMGDEMRIKQILMNLLGNAVKFTENGRIMLSVSLIKSRSESKATLSFTVSDTGIGIKPEDLQKLFSEFSQVDTKRNRNIEGTGLGLSISMNLAKMMNGSISVESEYGTGSAFTLTLEQGIANAKHTVHVPRELRNNTVYIFEPNVFYREAFISDCKMLGINVKTISDIKNAHNVLTNEKAYFLFDYGEGISRYENITAQFPELIVAAAVDLKTNFPEDKYPRLKHFSKPVTVYSIAEFIEQKPDTRCSKKADEIKMFTAPEARVLIVDDNITNLKVAEGLIEPYGVSITTVDSGNAAIRLFKSDQRFDLVFMDHMMPQLDGVDTVKFIRAMNSDYARSVPIVALTANAIKGIEELFYQAGMNDFIPKPIDIQKLNTVMRKWIPGDKQFYCDGSSTSQQEEDAYEYSAIFPNRSDIDYRSGIAAARNNQRIYLGILKTFASSDSLEKAEAYFNTNDFENYTILVHGVKSAAANIGAAKLSEEARMLEMAGKNKNYEFIRRNHQAFISNFSSVLEEIRGVFDKIRSIESTKPRSVNKIPTEELKEKLKQLITAAENMDATSAGKIKAELKNVAFDNKDAERAVLAALEDIESFDFDEAADKISKALLLL